MHSRTYRHSYTYTCFFQHGAWVETRAVPRGSGVAMKPFRTTRSGKESKDAGAPTSCGMLLCKILSYTNEMTTEGMHRFRRLHRNLCQQPPPPIQSQLVLRNSGTHLNHQTKPKADPSCPCKNRVGSVAVGRPQAYNSTDMHFALWGIQGRSAINFLRARKDRRSLSNR